MQNLIDNYLSEFQGKKIAIIGDLVADQFLEGTISRVSREAPVFILRHDETRTLAGAAANAAVNVASLGGIPILVGVTGLDANGDLLLETLRTSGVDCEHVICSTDVKTTTKIRVLAGQHYAPRQQVIRIDYENPAPFSGALNAQIEQNIGKVCEDADAIIISDYNYGAANPKFMETVPSIATAKSIPLLVDSRFRLLDFPGATSATPNQEEVENILGTNFSADDCGSLRERLGYRSLLVTRGNKGMLLLEEGKEPYEIAVVGSDEPIDVTGAGDTVIAVYALALACGASFRDAANLANHAGGIVVMKKGTACVTTAELRASLLENPQPRPTISAA
ncbi:MAG TPA: PfkB family carbohydrate kinase [Pyrinomonadaceae bacterium]|nr:PfkB family carbohydrate kinase [Pyrinomonadaceae bacterium]